MISIKSELDNTLEKLFSLRNMGVKLGIENIKSFLNVIDNPQLKIKTIHIAGSNGKGSTAAFISSILQEHGCRVGLYSSPHFVRFNERIKIGSKEIPDKYITEFIFEYYDYIIENKITFFEATTAMAFCYFKKQKVDYAIIETGLGGRLDATNTIEPLCEVITSISLEHTKTLGSTLSKIAEEKAGIIKNNSKVIIGKLVGEATEQIRGKCNKLNSELFELKNFIKDENENLLFQFNGMNLNLDGLPLLGKYQKYNAALALLTVKQIVNELKYEQLKQGVYNVIINTAFSGRYEFFNFSPDIIFDSAHNFDGVKNFVSEFKTHKSKYDKVTILFGALEDKDYKGMLNELRKISDTIFISKINSERNSDRNKLVSYCRQINFNADIVRQSDNFVKEFILRNKKECLIVIGSMYLLGDIKQGL